MDPIIKVDGKELESLLDQLRDDGDGYRIWSLRFAIDGDCVKVKINSGTWSPPLGGVEK
jgi:hypothetical protein